MKDSLQPFNKKNPERDYKIAGKSGVVCCKEDQPIYRKNFYTLDPNASDIKLQHTNGEEIIAAYAAIKEEEETIDNGLSL